MLPRELKQYSNRKLFIALGAIMGLCAIATIITLLALSALMEVRRAAQVNTAARTQLQTLMHDLRVAESNNRGYLITGDKNYIDRYNAAIKTARAAFAELDRLTQGVSYRAEIDKLSPLLESKFDNLDEVVSQQPWPTLDPGQAGVNLGQSRNLMDQIERQTNSIEATQVAQQTRDRASVQTLADLARNISVLTLVLTLALAVSVYYLYLKAIQSERRLDRAKDEFVSLASHQLRTPATGIKSILSTLVAGDFGELNERQTYFLRRALESNERELNIIEELLNVAKADAGRLILHSTKFELGKLIDAITLEQQSAIEKKNQKLTIKRPRQAMQVYGDEEKLYMAIGNLLDNARKYTPEFGELSIGFYRHHDEVRIEVTDTGVGIDSDEIEHIFDRFQRAKDALRGNVEGAGLGLYLAKRIAELQGGTIEVSSKLGKGTKFVMILPQGDDSAAKSSHS